MPRIHVLDLDTINKIAAGEVIERPASVVRELLDNALDARATRLTIDLEAGGRKLIRVSDDGTGMTAEELSLAIQNHATSKLEHIEDLSRITSLGFRGEALAALAAVSRLHITSCPPGAEIAHRIEVVDGQAAPVRPVAGTPGTTVTVLELFYNTPARREFLHSAASERRAILDNVTSYALAHPELRIRVRDDGRELLDLQATATMRERASDIFGRSLADNLADVEAEHDNVRLEGLASKPPYGRNNRQQQFLFVNGRPVRDRTVLFAITHAYQRTMEPGRFPVVVLSLTLPSSEVDVNVHPAKREVRFRDERALHTLVVEGLRRSIGPPGQTDHLPQPGQVVSVLRPWPGTRPERSLDGLETAERLYAPPDTGLLQPPLTVAEPQAPSLGEPPPRRPESGEDVLFWQLHNSYVFIQIKGGLVLVDQHAAHERVLFDQAVTALEGRDAQVQRLLFPIPLELSVRQFAAFEEGHSWLEKLGFSVRSFGGRSVLVEGIPSEMKNWEEGAVLLGILDDLAENRETKRLPLRDKILATYACRGAIMMGKKLSVAEMRALMDQLFATSLPYSCPHGRPTLMRIGLEDLHRKFQRS